jgi:tetratricopeptide (TPR) repeat protein
VREEVQDIFHHVADLAPEDRARYFHERRIDVRTRREVEALLVFDTEISAPLDLEIGRLAVEAVSTGPADLMPCGSYRLLEPLGSGGMGTVYLAERADGEVTQQVAVKLLRPGSDDPQFRTRFLSERQILAGLSHPRIARLLDAGHRADGQPYLVMEHVDGETIDVYADKLSVRQKVALFVKVCSAVSYLHRNLIVHRDLKPQNIMVTADGEPKLLDFGIAKMLESADTTVTAMRILTPDYASPEQVTGDAITTAADIYSLGAVLYKLLTGTTPHQYQGDTPMSMAIAIAVGAITPPSKLAPEVKGDLETVLMKALRTEPRERYATVEAFADDLQACLEWRPVQARSGDIWYRTRRWLRRYWVTAAAVGVVVISLAGGVFVANRQRVIAERRFNQLRQLSHKVIDIDAAIRSLPGSVDARQRLVGASLEYLEALYPEAGNNLALTQEIADGYWRLARIQGVSSEPNLGDSKKGEESLRKADLLVDRLLAANSRDRNALFRSAIIASDRGILADTEDRRGDYLAHARRAMQRLETLRQTNPATGPIHLDGFLRAGDAGESERTGMAMIYVNLGIGLVNAHIYDLGEQCARRAVELARPIPTAQDAAGQGLSVLANALRHQGDLEGALAAIHEARERVEQASYSSVTARRFAEYAVRVREGRILGETDAVNMGRPAEAIDALQSAMDMVETAASQDPNDSAGRARVATAARELGDILRERDPQRSLDVYDLGIRRLSEMKNSLKARRDRAQLLANSAYPLRRLHRNAEASSRIATALEILKQIHDFPAERIPAGSYDYAVLSSLADDQAASGDVRGAIGRYEDLLAKVQATGPNPKTVLQDAIHLSHLYETLAALNQRAGNGARAGELYARRQEIWLDWAGRLPNNMFIQRQLSTTASSADLAPLQPKMIR